MLKVLLIDDEPQMCALLSKVLTNNGFEVIVENDGASGLREAKRFNPDLILLDIIMPGLDGFEVAQRLRKDPACAQIPIMVLTAHATPYARKTATDAGVDDFVTKPFDLENLVAKVKTMTTGTYSSPNNPTAPLKSRQHARLISVHSLSGGLGCTALAINLAFALNDMWHKPTLLLDGDFASGQIALALQLSTTVSWSHVLDASASNSIHRALEDETIAHESGLHVLSAPRDPGIADRFSPRLIGHTLQLLDAQYDYIIADLAHDLRGNTTELLKHSETILYLLSAESVSMQLTKKALDTIAATGVKPANVELILVDTRPNNPIKVSDFEQYIGYRISAYIPYAADMTGAINGGRPFIKVNPGHEISTLIEDLAYLLSKPAHKDPTKSKPISSYQKPRPQLSSAGQNGKRHGVSRSILKRVGILN